MPDDVPIPTQSVAKPRWRAVAPDPVNKKLAQESRQRKKSPKPGLAHLPADDIDSQVAYSPLSWADWQRMYWKSFLEFYLH